MKSLFLTLFFLGAGNIPFCFAQGISANPSDQQLVAIVQEIEAQ